MLDEGQVATALPSGKEGVMPIEYKAGWTQEPAWTTGDRISLVLPGIEPRFYQLTSINRNRK